MSDPQPEDQYQYEQSDNDSRSQRQGGESPEFPDKDQDWIVPTNWGRVKRALQS